jgi:GNAT superfamily N-acetyltransferase
MRVVPLGTDDLSRIGDIDRTEHVDVQLGVVDGRLVEQPVVMADIPAWDPVGSGPHSVAAHIEWCETVLASGAAFLGALDGDQTAGLAIVDPSFEPELAWLAFLHVSRPHRRRGVASALWGAAVAIAREADAAAIYVSATPTGSALGFYLRQGCRLADPVHPDLYAHEPDDIHLVCAL